MPDIFKAGANEDAARNSLSSPYDELTPTTCDDRRPTTDNGGGEARLVPSVSSAPNFGRFVSAELCGAKRDCAP